MTRPTRRILLPRGQGLISAATLCASLALLPGCGGDSGPAAGGGGPAVDALSNPAKILFASGRSEDAKWRYYVMNEDGSGVALVPGLSTLNARLSAGGRLNRGGNIALLDADFGTGAGISHSAYRLSDGVRLLNVVSTFATTPTVITANTAGTVLAVAGVPATGDASGIYTLNAGGSGKTLLAALPAGQRPLEIAYAPDDATLYFITSTSTDSTAPNKLYRLTAGSSSPVLVADTGKRLRSIQFTDDGSKVGFIAMDATLPDGPTLFTPYTMNPDGTGLTTGADIRLETWTSPSDVTVVSRTDGFHILYSLRHDETRDIMDVRLDGTGTTQLTFNAAGNDNPVSRFKTSASSGFSGFGGMVGGK